MMNAGEKTSLPLQLEIREPIEAYMGVWYLVLFEIDSKVTKLEAMFKVGGGQYCGLHNRLCPGQIRMGTRMREVRQYVFFE